jgi:hypothetical protein
MSRMNQLPDEGREIPLFPLPIMVASEREPSTHTKQTIDDHGGCHRPVNFLLPAASFDTLLHNLVPQRSLERALQTSRAPGVELAISFNDENRAIAFRIGLGNTLPILLLHQVPAQSSFSIFVALPL